MGIGPHSSWLSFLSNVHLLAILRRLPDPLERKTCRRPYTWTIYMNDVNLMHVDRLRLQTYEQYCAGDESCDQLSSGQLTSGQRSSGQLSSGHRQTDRCLDAVVSVHGSVLTVGCVCSTQDNSSYSTCDAARKRLPHKLSPCAGITVRTFGASLSSDEPPSRLPSLSILPLISQMSSGMCR